METNNFQFKGLDGQTYIATDAKAEISKCMDFVAKVTLHEVVHNSSGVAGVITNGNTGTINYKDDLGQNQTSERGDYFENNAYGKVMSHGDADAGIIPLIEINKRQIWCQLPPPANCFPTEKEKTESYKKSASEESTTIKNRGYKEQ